MLKRLPLSILLLVLLMPACTRPIELGSDFIKLSDHFAEAMRWQDFHGAARLVVAAERDAFLDEFPSNKDLHMVEVGFEQVDLNQAEGVAGAVLLVEYYLLPSVTVREWRWSQQWRRMDTPSVGGSTWMIQAPPPAFPGPETAK
ncbi:MAG: hypothetical protein C0619_15275 [Desulfuromonas sp.]|nr:MAG: hypothetical protein C0619_15275 [Desulfuromonas sp.]